MINPIQTFNGLRGAGRWTLLAIALVCSGPLVAAIYLYFLAPPALKSIAGERLEPFAFPYESVQTFDGQPMAHPVVGERWLLVHAGEGACAPACRDALYLTRQARLAQGRNMERIQRILIVTDTKPPNADMLAAHPDLLVLRVTDARVVQQLRLDLPNVSLAIHLVDRRGFVVFRYASSVEPSAFVRELGKLVKF